MLILTIRTDRPEAEIGLFDGNKELAYGKWQADRQLAETIHQKIRDILALQGLTLQEGVLGGVICFKGPGSFTGLRIGLAVANTIAYSFSLPIVGETGDGWQISGTKRLLNNENDGICLPEYGQDARITLPKK